MLPAPAPKPCAGRIDPGRAFLDRGERVGDRQREIVVAVKTDFALERIAQRADALARPIDGQGAGRVGHIDGVRTVGLHQPRLRREGFGRAHVRHHQEAADRHAELAREADVLLRDIGLGAMRRDAHHFGAELARGLEIVARADSLATAEL